jgi:ornithine decarboxylase
MEEGYHGPKYVSEVGFADRLSSEPLLSLKSQQLKDDVVISSRSLDDSDDRGLSSTYSSDSENSSAGQTDGSDSCGSPKDSSISRDLLISDAYQVIKGLSRVVGKPVFNGAPFGSVPHFIHSRVQNKLETGSFLVTNLAPIVAQFDQWKAELPMVEPFYAVKCNPDPTILRLLASLGCNFDCATMGEIDLVLNGLGDQSFAKRGIASTSIVYANPAKMEHMVQFAMDNSVRMTVFDGEDELHKIAGLGGQSKMDLLLRLTTDDKASICRFSKKFGCPVDEAPKLLRVAKSLGLRVVGVSFHVGSGCGDSDAYTTALSHARRVFDAAESLGMEPMTVVDLGGGFPGDTGGYGGPGMPTFQQLASAIRAGIAAFGDDLGRPADAIRFIAEPGRYFVSASTTISTKVYARKGGDNDYQALYVDDGVYGSFNNVVYDHALPVPLRLESVIARTSQSDSDDDTAARMAAIASLDIIPTAVFGPTCDGLDQNLLPSSGVKSTTG